MKILNQKSLNFNDVNLISNKISVVKSRENVWFDTNRLIVAPMSALQNKEFNLACIASGVSLPLHRFCSIEEQHLELLRCVENRKLLKSNSKLWLSVGLNDFEDRIDPVYEILKENDVGILFDVANGFAMNLGEALKLYNVKYKALPNLMTGNVHSWEGFHWLEKQPNNSKFIRLGVANGAACDTRIKTGIVRGQISCIKDVSEELHDALIVSDGGIKTPADVCKAFGAGADYVMMGGYFANAKESESQKTGLFYGGASSVQKEKIGSNKNRYVEGKVLNVELSAKSLNELVSDISDGVKSAISYSGFDNLEDFIGNGVFDLNV